MSQFNTINSSKLAPPVGPYSPAVKVGSFVFSSGQIALDPSTGQLVSGGVAEQADRVMKNIELLLKEAGTEFSKVIKTTIFLQSIQDFGTVNEIYAKFFKEPYPARSTVEVAKLPKGALVEIEVIAAV